MRIAIIGGGAAGMMAAVTVGEINTKAEIFLLEKNVELGKKVLISGGGRCNVTTCLENITAILQKYPRGSKFLQAAMRSFPPIDVMAWFERHGVPLKCEKDQRVFPVSNDSNDIVNVFSNLLACSKTNILLKRNITGITKTFDDFIIQLKDRENLRVDKIILALGGQAYRHTGSTVDGYSLAESFGHKITTLAPSLSSLVTLEKWPQNLAGVSFSKATFIAKGVKRHTFSGPFLFTHTGITGPAIFALSSLFAFEKFDLKKPLAVTIDLLPDKSTEKLFSEMKLLMEKTPKKSFKNTLHTFIPLSVAEIICAQLQIPPEKKNAETNKHIQREALRWLKQMPLSIVGRGAGDEFVTAGGVELTEVNPHTMESKLCHGLYFAGEILNIDGFTGGFNLQASWSTGRAAGVSAAQEKS